MPILDVVCSILTGSALVAFMYAAVARDGSVHGGRGARYGFLRLRAERAFRRGPSTAFLWGWATALVAIACLLVTVERGILSAVQVALDELEAAGHGQCIVVAHRGASRRSSARFWARPP